MKNDIILAGVGGQGILSIAATIGMAAVDNGLYLKQAEVHGMSQRGGDVQSHLRISDKEIASDLIPKGSANMILSVEPMESLRYLPWLNKDGWLITNTKPMVNIPDYPKQENIQAEIAKVPQHITLDADKIARDLGTARAANIVVLGAASPYIDITYESLENAIRAIFKNKGDKIIQLNLDALKVGREIALSKN